ncbi:hypothetical protein DL93DRAFT_2173167 [Clavulina sp. PMI_390]|nr:hypothetical protein DL93DRAFT_2173167 [Clavulina sp. PMI_390]
MAQFGDLPVELVLEIISYLQTLPEKEEYFYPGDLAALSIVCRSLNKVVERVLYHKVILPPPHDHDKRVTRATPSQTNSKAAQAVVVIDAVGDAQDYSERIDTYMSQFNDTINPVSRYQASSSSDSGASSASDEDPWYSPSPRLLKEPDIYSRYIVHFARTICQSPRLASHLKSLSIEFHSLTSQRDQQSLDVELERSRWLQYVKDPLDLWKSESYRWAANMHNELKELSKAALELGLPNGMVYFGPEPGWLVLLLFHVPKLRSLFIIAGDKHLQMISFAATRWFLGSVPMGLQSLTTLQLQYTYNLGGIAPETFFPLLLLPNLISFGIDGLSGGENAIVPLLDFTSGHSRPVFGPLPTEAFLNFGDVDPNTDAGTQIDECLTIGDPIMALGRVVLMPRSVFVSDFTLEASVVDPALFQRMMEMFDGLRSFLYTIGEESLFAINDEYVDVKPQAIVTALLPQVHTLRELIIGFESCVGWYESHGRDLLREERLLGDLRSFGSLKYLRAPVEMLLHLPDRFFDAPRTPAMMAMLPTRFPPDEPIHEHPPLEELLPRSLIYLIIDSADDDTPWTLESVIEAINIPQSSRRWAERLPALERIRIISKEGSFSECVDKNTKMFDVLREWGFVRGDDDMGDAIDAFHLYITRSPPSRLRADRIPLTLASLEPLPTLLVEAVLHEDDGLPVRDYFLPVLSDTEVDTDSGR